MTVRFNVKQKINIREGRFMVAAAAAGTSGDTACVCSLPGGRLAFILSDGMGKGMKAAAESRVVVEELRKLLKKGFPPAQAIKLVNKKLIDNNDSSKKSQWPEVTFATIDLIIIDKVGGFARFYKLGAACSFLLRNGHIKKIQRSALPVGVFQRVSASQIKVKLRVGDTLIIVSDGITEADKQDLEVTWLGEYLRGIPTNIGPRVLASEIASIAKSKYMSRQTDDITVFAVQIK